MKRNLPAHLRTHPLLLCNEGCRPLVHDTKSLLRKYVLQKQMDVGFDTVYLPLVYTMTCVLSWLSVVRNN